MNNAAETIVDIQKSMREAMERVSKINADNLRYVDIKYIREHLMSALSDTDSLVDDLMAEAVKDKYGDYDEDPSDPYDSDMLITNDFCIECIAKYRGHEVRIILYNSTGCRCGYVKLQQPVLNCDDIECHGGVTFNAYVESDDDRFGGRPGNWIGFDCAHSGDLPDMDYVSRYFPDDLRSADDFYALSTDGTVRLAEYVLKECHHIVDQLIDRVYNK